MSRNATTKRKIAEAQINPNSLSGYYVGNEIDPGGWTKDKLNREDWTKDERLIPRYQQVPKKAWRLERHGTYNTQNFITLRSGDFYPGELLLIDFPPVINELPITKRTHVKANRIWDINHRRIQDDRGMAAFIEYNTYNESTIQGIENNIRNNIKKRADTATRDFMVIYAPHDKLVDIIKFLAFDENYIHANTTAAGATTIYVTFEMYLHLIAKFHPFAVFYYHWKITESQDMQMDMKRAQGGGVRTGPTTKNGTYPSSSSQGKWVVVEYKRTDSEWNQYGIPVDRYDKALGQLTCGMINETGNISPHFENALWETTVLYTVETIKAEVLEKEYLPEYMPFNGLERMDRDDGIVLPRGNQTFEPTHGMSPKVTIMSNRGENKFINTRFLWTELVDPQGRPLPGNRDPDQSFFPNYNNTTDMTQMTLANPFSNICGNKEAILECITRQLNTALDTTLDQTDVYNENFIIQGDQQIVQQGPQNLYIALPSRKRAQKSAIQARARPGEEDYDDILDKTETLKDGQCNPDGTVLELEVTTLTDEKVVIKIENRIIMKDRSFKIEGRKIQVATREGEIVVSQVTGKLNKYDMIIAVTGNGTEEHPFKVEQNFGSLIKERHDHCELGVMLDPKDKEFKYFIAGARANTRTTRHELLHRIQPSLVINGLKHEFIFCQYIGSPNKYKGFFLTGEFLPGAFKGEPVECLKTSTAMGEENAPIGFPLHDHWQGLIDVLVMFEERFETDEEKLEQAVGTYIDAPTNLLEGQNQGDIDVGRDSYLPNQPNADASQLRDLKLVTAKPIYTKVRGTQTLERITINGYINYYFETLTISCGLNRDKNTWDYTPTDKTLDWNPNIKQPFRFEEHRMINQEEMQHVSYLVMNKEVSDHALQFEMLYICVPTENFKSLVVARILKGPGVLRWEEGRGIIADIQGFKSYDIFKFEGITHAGPEAQPKAIMIADKNDECTFVNLAFTKPTYEDSLGNEQFLMGSILTELGTYALNGVKRKAGTNRAIFGAVLSVLAPLASDLLVKGISWGAQKLFNWIGGKKAVRATMPYIRQSNTPESQPEISNVSSIFTIISNRGCAMFYHRYLPTAHARDDIEAEVKSSRDDSLHKCWADDNNQPIVLGEWLKDGSHEWFSCVRKPFNKADEDKETKKSPSAYVTLQNPYDRNGYVPGLDINGDHVDVEGHKSISNAQKAKPFYSPIIFKTQDDVDKEIKQDSDIFTIIESCEFESKNGHNFDLGKLFGYHAVPIDVETELRGGRRGEMIPLNNIDPYIIYRPNPISKKIQQYTDTLPGLGDNLRLINPYNSSMLTQQPPYRGLPHAPVLKNTSVKVYQILADRIPSVASTSVKLYLTTANSPNASWKHGKKDIHDQDLRWEVGDWYKLTTPTSSSKPVTFVISGSKPSYDHSLLKPVHEGAPTVGTEYSNHYDPVQDAKFKKAELLIDTQTGIYSDVVRPRIEQTDLNHWRQWVLKIAGNREAILKPVWNLSYVKDVKNSNSKQQDDNFSWQTHHRILVQYKDKQDDIQLAELMNPVLNFFLHQTSMWRADGLTTGHAPIASVKPTLNIGTTEKGIRFSIADLTIGLINGTTHDVNHMNFITILYLPEISTIHTVEQGGIWKIVIRNPSLTAHYGREEYEITLEGTDKGLELPIKLEHDEEIGLYGYFGHQKIKSTQAKRTSGKGWCQITADGVFKKIDDTTMPLIP